MHLLIIPFFAFFVATLAAQEIDFAVYKSEAEKWEKAIKKLEKLDTEEQHPDKAILFIGSSSIKRWREIKENMAPFHPIQRGFGGSKWSDVAVFADRLITPHKFRAAVFFVGNDIVGKQSDKSPEQVLELVKFVHGRVRAHAPEAAIFFLEVTPTPARINAYTSVQKAHVLQKAFCEKEKNTHFIETEAEFLKNGAPRPELFVKDKLHLNQDGYDLWAKLIKASLTEHLK